MSIDYLLLGALTNDVGVDGILSGGTSWYAGHAATRWELQTAIISSIAQTEPPPHPLPQRLLRIPSSTTATFINRYHGDQRTQYLLAAPSQIPWAAIPPAWLRASIIHLAPIANELLPLPERKIAEAFIGVTPQGWLRTWDGNGRIKLREWHPTPIQLAHVNAIVLSEEDLPDAEITAAMWATAGPIVALTRGSKGVTIWEGNQSVDIPAYHADVLDLTGAGDVWAAAFFWRLWSGESIPNAACWACAAAACAIEGIGIQRLPSKIEVEQRLKGNKMIA